jgi:hypothetical protein
MDQIRQVTVRYALFLPISKHVNIFVATDFENITGLYDPNRSTTSSVTVSAPVNVAISNT